MQRYIYSGLSLKNKRPTNMDSLLLKCRVIDGSNAILAVICDGVGSLVDGGFASGAATRMLNEWFDLVEGTERMGLRLRDAVLMIHSQIAAQAEKYGLQTAATISSLLLMNGKYYIVHIGDSRIYAYDHGNNGLSVLTKDDVSASGKLTGYIGRSGSILLQYGEGYAADKVFLVCSDGLYKGVDEHFIAEKMQVKSQRMAQEAVKVLTNCAVARGESDNISVALIKEEK